MGTRRALAAAAGGMLAGMAAGVVTGAAARLAMRMVADGVADGVGVRTDFTVGGTAAILVSGLIVGAPLGLAYVLFAERVPGRPWARGLVFGALALALIGPVFLRTEEFFSLGRVALFAPLFLIFGVAVGLAAAPSRDLVSRALGIAGARA